MARSPVRRDARDRRDHDYRRRSRDRGGHRHDDRHDDRGYGGGRFDDRRDRDYVRPRSRERKRSREASPVRDRERREPNRYRDDRHYDDRNRDSKRMRYFDDQPTRRHRGDSGDSRESRAAPGSAQETSRPSTADAEEEAKKARQAKVEAWKKKQLLKKGVEGIASPSAGDSAAASPAGASAAAESSTAQNGSGGSAPAAPVKKFVDPKMVQKKAAAAMEREKQKATLGGDVQIPKSAPHARAVDAKLANTTKEMHTDMANGASNLPDNKIGGFGLSTATADTKDRSAVAKTAVPLGEEEETARKLEKLPNMPMQIDSGDAARANDSDYQDEDNDVRSDDEEADAIRQAAQKRAEEVQAQAGQDSIMANGPHVAEEIEEEVDPLDAFMSGLEQPEIASTKSKERGRQVFDNEDDDGANLNAIGDDGEAAIAAAVAKTKRKEIPKVDYDKIELEPFRKDFYTEPVELSEMTSEEVEAVRADLDNIKCRGVNVPKPILKWSQGGFGAQILEVIREQKFEKPTSIQSQALPAIMSGRDVIGIAKTGSGKTTAFILPMFRHIKDQRPLGNLEGPIGLIVAPTRELATQIHRDCRPYLRALNLRAVCCYGGAPIKDQIAELKRGAEIIVCTPGRMIDLLTANAGRVVNLTRVTYVVLDEADRMFDMGFEPQITRMLSRIRPQRQTVLFSATFPKNMEALARKALTKPVEIIVGGRSVVAAEIEQKIMILDNDEKFRRVLYLLGQLTKNDDDARCLIFVERQETADNLLKELAKRQYPAVSIHGGRDQIDRDQAIDDFKNGIFPVMIATSVAARGLDVKQLKLVINYDCPNHIEDYVHRSGRTGRAGNTGTAATLLTPEQDRFAGFLVRALQDSKQEVPQQLLELAKAYEEKVKSGAAKKISSGFGGRGVERLDAERDAEKAAQRKQYKTEDDGDDDEEEAPKKSKANAEVEKMMAKAVGTVNEREGRRGSQGTQGTQLPTDLDNHLRNAMQVKKSEPPAPKNHGGRSGKKSSDDVMARVAAAAAGVNSRLGSKNKPSSEIPSDYRSIDAGEFSAFLIINDFPQAARWRVTNRSNVVKILDQTGVSITTKGTFYAKDVEPKEGDLPKLYVVVEGDTQGAVETAMGQLTTLLREGTIEAIQKESGVAAQPGRYTV